MTPFEMLAHLRDTLVAAFAGQAACKIGIEANITAADYPLVRLVPTRLVPQIDGTAGRRRMQVTAYFGDRLQESADGLAIVYAGLLAMEATLRDAVTLTAVRTAREAGQYLKATYVDTLTDEDRLPHYKLMACRFEIES